MGAKWQKRVLNFLESFIINVRWSFATSNLFKNVVLVTYFVWEIYEFYDMSQDYKK